MKFNEELALQKCEDMLGWIDGEERVQIYKMAKAAPAEGVVVEIGSWCGKSTTVLACASIAAGAREVYAVDPFHKPEKMAGIGSTYDTWAIAGLHDTYEEFVANMKGAGVEDIVVPIRAMSEDAIEIYREKYGFPIRFLFIDGCHQQDYVQKDWDLWSPLVMVGGGAAFHDAYYRDYRSVLNVAQVAFESPGWGEQGQCNSLAYAWRLSE